MREDSVLSPSRIGNSTRPRESETGCDKGSSQSGTVKGQKRPTSYKRSTMTSINMNGMLSWCPRVPHCVHVTTESQRVGKAICHDVDPPAEAALTLIHLWKYMRRDANMDRLLEHLKDARSERYRSIRVVRYRIVVCFEERDDNAWFPDRRDDDPL